MALYSEERIRRWMRMTIDPGKHGVGTMPAHLS